MLAVELNFGFQAAKVCINSADKNMKIPYTCII